MIGVVDVVFVDYRMDHDRLLVDCESGVCRDSYPGFCFSSVR
jgi:hypothetical protein